ncbi:MAG: hypothetical protein ACFFFH_10175 [Candidatus Thorarchaeota archaeon]
MIVLRKKVIISFLLLLLFLPSFKPVFNNNSAIIPDQEKNVLRINSFIIRKLLPICELRIFEFNTNPHSFEKKDNQENPSLVNPFKISQGNSPKIFVHDHNGNWPILNNTVVTAADFSKYFKIIINDSDDLLDDVAYWWDTSGPGGAQNLNLQSYTMYEPVSKVWADGPHILHVSANDSLGHYSEISVTIIYDTQAPTIDSPADISYEVGTSGHFISWSPSDANPVSYNITRDGALIKTGLWNSSSEMITISINGLDVGSYIYRCSVYDSANQSSHDEVTVSAYTPPKIFIHDHNGNWPILNNTVVTAADFSKYFKIIINDSDDLIDDVAYWWDISGPGGAQNLNQQSYTMYAPVSKVWVDGPHILHISANDSLGHYSEISVTIIYDTQAPTIDSPADISYEVGTSGHFISWSPSDANPVSYNITRDGALIKTGLWNSSSEMITISINGLDVGSYIYRCSVYDSANQSSHDEVTVSVYEPLETTTTTTETSVYTSLETTTTTTETSVYTSLETTTTTTETSKPLSVITPFPCLFCILLILSLVSILIRRAKIHI